MHLFFVLHINTRILNSLKFSPHEFVHSRKANALSYAKHIPRFSIYWLYLYDKDYASTSLFQEQIS